LTRRHEGIHGIEGGAIDDRRDLIFDDFSGFLALAVALAIAITRLAGWAGL
jgi:hypothetical protein